MSEAQTPTPKTVGPPLRIFASLLNSKKDLQKVTATIHDLVAISFITHPVAWRTAAEEKHRGELLIKWFGVMRKDHGFSLSRTLAMLPFALKAELNGDKNWTPPKERLYRVG